MHSAQPQPPTLRAVFRRPPPATKRVSVKGNQLDPPFDIKVDVCQDCKCIKIKLLSIVQGQGQTSTNLKLGAVYHANVPMSEKINASVASHKIPLHNQNCNKAECSLASCCRIKYYCAYLQVATMTL